MLDEGIPPRERFLQTNKHHNVRHIKHDFHYGGYTDEFVYQFASKQKRLLVTLNILDFKKLFSQNVKTTGIIALGHNLSYKEIDKKLCKLLTSTPKKLYGNFTKITNETGKRR